MRHKLRARLCAGQGELESIAREILDCHCSIIILSGEVGSGKTTLTQALLTCLRARESTAQSRTQSTPESTMDSHVSSHARSPTFSIMHDYGGMYHYDLYNHSTQELLHLGLLEWLGERGLHCIEWGEDLVDMLEESGFSCMVVRIFTPESCPQDFSKQDPSKLDSGAQDSSWQNVQERDSGDSRIYELYL